MASSACKFKSILVANRGEIAVRIIRSLKAMGIRSHAVYSEDDADSLHVKQADINHPLGSNKLSESYLNIKKLIEICKRNKIDAVHPGYGFLSENPDFARSLKKAGIAFIGPDPVSMELLGNKVNAKKAAKRLGIPTLELQKVGPKTRFPVVIKAAGGGGGRGMRIVKNLRDFESSLESAKREAKNAFKDETVFIEQYLEDVRHIEVQVACDNYGNALHIYDRECSLQRNHQKIIEEAPALNIPPKIKEKLYRAAISICKAARYRNLCTVEFLVDRANRFYFLEANTRLQVEHTVTEEVTGLDLVKLQIELAAGRKLREILPKPPSIKAHAIQCRVCSECPESHFAPTGGIIERLTLPDKAGLRIDCGIKKGSKIGFNYDSLLLKLITCGKDRSAAIGLMREAVSKLEIFGVVSNLGFISLVLDSKEYKSYRLNTALLSQLARTANWEKLYAEAASDYLVHELSSAGGDIWDQRNAFRISGERPLVREELLINGAVKTDARIEPGSKRLNLKTAGVTAGRSQGTWFQSSRGSLKIEKAPKSHLSKSENSAAARSIKASLPGKIVKLKISLGKALKAGQEILIMESMKMEHIIRAPRDAVVKKVSVKEGQFVESGSLLVEFE